MNFGKKIAAGLVAAAAGLGQPSPLEDRSREEIVWTQNDAAAFVALAMGRRREELERDFTMSWMYRAGPKRKTIIHGLQTHWQGGELRRELRDRIFSSQAKFARVIVNLWREKKIECMYVEGATFRFADEWNASDASRLAERYKEMQRKRDRVKASSAAARNLLEAMDVLEDATSELTKLEDIAYYHLFGQEVFEMFEHFLPRFERLLSQESPTMRLTLSPIIDNARKLIEEHKVKHGKPHPLVLGAHSFLAMHGLPVRVCPTSTPELDAKLGPIMKRIHAAERAPTELDAEIQILIQRVQEVSSRKPGETLEEMLRDHNERRKIERDLSALKERRKEVIRKRVVETIEQDREVIFTLREQAALSFIHTIGQNSDVPMAYLHFGLGHRDVGRNIGHIPENKRYNILSMEPK